MERGSKQKHPAKPALQNVLARSRNSTVLRIPITGPAPDSINRNKKNALLLRGMLQLPAAFLLDLPNHLLSVSMTRTSSQQQQAAAAACLPDISRICLDSFGVSDGAFSGVDRLSLSCGFYSLSLKLSYSLSETTSASSCQILFVLMDHLLALPCPRRSEVSLRIC